MEKIIELYDSGNKNKKKPTDEIRTKYFYKTYDKRFFKQRIYPTAYLRSTVQKGNKKACEINILPKPAVKAYISLLSRKLIENI